MSSIHVRIVQQLLPVLFRSVPGFMPSPTHNHKNYLLHAGPAYSHAQTPPSSRKEKGSGVTNLNLWASSRSMEQLIRCRQVPTAQSDVMKSLKSYTNNYKASVLLLAQGFGLVTPDPFSLRELGGVWAGD